MINKRIIELAGLNEQSLNEAWHLFKKQYGHVDDISKELGKQFEKVIKKNNGGKYIGFASIGGDFFIVGEKVIILMDTTKSIDDDHVFLSIARINK